jgi:hypothetical protein
VLFPHMNSDDKFVFLNDIKSCVPEKFELAWNSVLSIIDENERNNLKGLLNISTDKASDGTVKLFYPWENQPGESSHLMTNYHKNHK